MNFLNYEEKANEYWREKSQTDDEFYFGLGDRIKERQEGKIPEAGQGAIDAMGIFSKVFTGIGTVIPPVRKIGSMFETIKWLMKERVRDTSGTHLSQPLRILL